MAIELYKFLIYFGYEPDIYLLSGRWFANIFSYSIVCLFILLIVSFAVQKAFIYFLWIFYGGRGRRRGRERKAKVGSMPSMELSLGPNLTTPRSWPEKMKSWVLNQLNRSFLVWCSPTHLFLLLLLCFCVIFKKSLPKPMSRSFFSIFSSRIIKVSSLNILVFKDESLISFLAYEFPVFQFLSVEETILFLLTTLGSLS